MRRQAIRYGAAGTVGLVLVLAATILVNYVSARRYVKKDWTTSKVYTLSERSANLVRDLDETVRAVVFMVPGSPLYSQVRELLEQYVAVSDRIEVEYIDPDREPLTTRQLAEEFGISVADTVVFVAGERTRYVTSDQMAEYDYQGMQLGGAPKMTAFTGEEQFTSAILSLVAPDVPKVYVVAGHGEASLEATAAGPGERSLTVLSEALSRETIETEPLELFAGQVPDDADVVAIIGPTRPYTEVEIEALGRFLDRGGRLLVCLDPVIDPAGTMRATRLEELLAERGVETGDDLVIDPARKLPFYDLSAVYLTDFADHPVTTGMEGLAVLFTITRSVSAAGDGVELVETSADGWGETDLGMLLRGDPVDVEEADTPGPVSVAVAVEGEGEVARDVANAGGDDADTESSGPPQWRMVVFGDSDFLSDVQISNAGNLALAMNAFNWLAERERSLGIPPRQVEEVSLYLSGDQLRAILLVVLVVLPGAAVAAGVLVWRRRRH